MTQFFAFTDHWPLSTVNRLCCAGNFSPPALPYQHVQLDRSTPEPPGRQAAQMRYTSGAAAVPDR